MSNMWNYIKNKAKNTWNWIKSRTKKFWGWVSVAILGGAIMAATFVPAETPYAQLAVIKENKGGYEKGDIIQAFNARRILDVNAQMAVKDDLYLQEFYQENTYEYKFERISEKEVRRTNLFTGTSEILSDVPNKKGEYIYVEDFIERRLASGNKTPIYGEKGSERWYGGKIVASLNKLDIIWNEIEGKTNERKDQNLSWPFTDREREFIAIVKAEDFNDIVRAELESPLLSLIADSEGNFPIIKQRKYKIDFENLDLNKKHRHTDILNIKTE